jgi:hypothetical protein
MGARIAIAGNGNKRPLANPIKAFFLECCTSQHLISHIVGHAGVKRSSRTIKGAQNLIWPEASDSSSSSYPFPSAFCRRRRQLRSSKGGKRKALSALSLLIAAGICAPSNQVTSGSGCRDMFRTALARNRSAFCGIELVAVVEELSSGYIWLLRNRGR